MILRKLAEAGYRIAPATELEKALRNWLQLQHRRIERRPRAVYRSDDLRRRQSTLPLSQQSALSRIAEVVRAGGDLNPYLSRDLRKKDRVFKAHDGLLNEAGFHHFHLGAGLDGKGMITGTDELLFAHVDDDAVRFLDVFTHDDFVDERPFQIAQRNWPLLFEPWRIDMGRSGFDEALSDEERSLLRKRRVNRLLIAENGTTFLPPGGGSSTSGHSSRVIIAADRMLDAVDRAQTLCLQNGESLATEMARAGLHVPEELRLRFDGFTSDGHVKIVDEGRVFCFTVSAGHDAPR